MTNNISFMPVSLKKKISNISFYPKNYVFRYFVTIFYVGCFLTILKCRCVQILTDWLCKRTAALEEIFPEKWPENGLKLSTVFFKVQKKLSDVGFIR